jgi:hypothetical protein
LDVKYWKKRHDEKEKERYKLKLSTYCFVCDEMMTSFKDLEYHIKESKHAGNVEDFVRSIPVEMRTGKWREREKKAEEGIY